MSVSTEELRCKTAGCNKVRIAQGFCKKHYQIEYRAKRIATKSTRAKGTGTISSGYSKSVVNGRYVADHVRIAENALGRKLAVGEEVHHVGMDRGNNTTTNLVICPDRAYHQLLHKIQRSLDATGDANKLRCYYCHQYDDPRNIKKKSKSNTQFQLNA